MLCTDPFPPFPAYLTLHIRLYHEWLLSHSGVSLSYPLHPPELLASPRNGLDYNRFFALSSLVTRSQSLVTYYSSRFIPHLTSRMFILFFFLPSIFLLAIFPRVPFPILVLIPTYLPTFLPLTRMQCHSVLSTTTVFFHYFAFGSAHRVVGGKLMPGQFAVFIITFYLLYLSLPLPAPFSFSISTQRVFFRKQTFVSKLRIFCTLQPTLREYEIRFSMLYGQIGGRTMSWLLLCAVSPPPVSTPVEMRRRTQGTKGTND